MMRPLVLASLLAACHGSTGASTGGTTARATGSFVYHFSCSPSPTDDGTSGGTEPPPPDCCSGFGAVNPCTITVAFVASWTAA